jgi:DNA-binding transcriptional regulator YiaG
MRGMANIAALLNLHIRRLARRETKTEAKTVRRLSSQHRRDIAELKRQVARLQRSVAFLERQERRRVASHAVQTEQAEGIRFRADGLKSHRKRLGLSAADYARLVGVSGLSIYNWESGKMRPRKAQVAKLASLRGLGKREAAKRLQILDSGRSN